MLYKLAGFESPAELHKATMDLLIHRTQEMYFSGDLPEVELGEDPAPQREQFHRIVAEEYEQLKTVALHQLEDVLKSRYRRIRKDLRDYLRGVQKEGIGEAKIYAWLVLEDHFRVMLERATPKEDPTGLGTIKGYDREVDAYDGAGWNDMIHDRDHSLDRK